MTIAAAITLAIAVLGAGLGIINTWLSLDKSRVKLRVRPMRAIPLGAANPRLTFMIEVTNLSAFAVTVCDVGLFFSGTKERLTFVNPITGDGEPWPRRLEPRSSVSIYGEPPASTPEHRLKCAYARTECGVTRTGTSPAFKALR
jgi:hypothetical protein